MKLVLGCRVSIEVVHLHRRGHPRSPRGTVTLYTHSRSGHPAGRFPRLVCPASPPGPTTYFLASRWHPSHRVFSCTSCASRFASCTSRLYRAVARGRMHKSQCCASATECSAASCNNAPVPTPLMHTRRVYASCYIATLLLHFLRISSFLILKWTLQTRSCEFKQIKVKIMQSQ